VGVQPTKNGSGKRKKGWGKNAFIGKKNGEGQFAMESGREKRSGRRQRQKAKEKHTLRRRKRKKRSKDADNRDVRNRKRAFVKDFDGGRREKIVEKDSMSPTWKSIRKRREGRGV